VVAPLAELEADEAADNLAKAAAVEAAVKADKTVRAVADSVILTIGTQRRNSLGHQPMISLRISTRPRSAIMRRSCLRH
jgi:plasmid stabilization system protein ParE